MQIVNICRTQSREEINERTFLNISISVNKMFVRTHDTVICFSVKSTKLVEMAMGLTRKPIEKKVESLALRIWNFFLLLSPCFRDICCRKRSYTHKHLLRSISRTILCHVVMNNVFRYVYTVKSSLLKVLKIFFFHVKENVFFSKNWISRKLSFFQSNTTFPIAQIFFSPCQFELCNIP